MVSTGTEAAQVPPVRVMLVDDQAAFLRSATLALDSDPGLEVVASVASALDAMSELDAGRGVDVALVDLSMPGINGLEAIAWIGRHHPGVVTVLMSTYEPDELPEAARRADVAYLRKADLTPERVVACAHRAAPDGPPAG
jgi:DNA-binding NarL/FixJ family response regulator